MGKDALKVDQQGGAGFLNLDPKMADTDSLFFVSLPKSGTVYTWNMLSNTTGLAIPDFHELTGWSEYTIGRDFACPELYACGDYNTQLLLPDQMKLYLRGFIFGAHMQASYHNMQVLKESGIGQIAVLLRDPRDAFVSWVHHLANLGPSARDYHSKIYSLPTRYYDWSLEEQFSYQIRAFLPTVINWVEGWLNYYASDDREIDVLFVYYDQLKSDPKGYISRILEFHSFEQGNLDAVSDPEPGKMHFRKGEHGQYREEFSEPDQELAQNLMGSRIAELFNVAAESHVMNMTYSEHVGRGDFASATEAALIVLRQFPNYRAGYQKFMFAAERAGANIRELETMIDQALSTAPEDQFLCRPTLITHCETILATTG